MLPKPPNGYLDRNDADAKLRHFIHAGRFDGPEPLPKRAEPVQAGEAVKKALDVDSPKSREVSQCFQLMRFFDLWAHSEHVSRWLTRRESKDDEYVRSLVSISILGEMGSPPQQDQANEYYKYLAGRPTVDQRFEPMIDVLFFLNDKADPKWIQDPIEKKMKSLEPGIEQKHETKVAYHKLKNLRDDRLQRILSAKARRIEISQIADARRRRHELIRTYLRLEEFAHVDFKGWAAAMLQHDCNANTPKELADAFGILLDQLMSPASIEGVIDEDKPGVATSCARGYTFYGGVLSEAQLEFVNKMKREQADLLYWDENEQPTAKE